MSTHHTHIIKKTLFVLPNGHKLFCINVLATAIKTFTYLKLFYKLHINIWGWRGQVIITYLTCGGLRGARSGPPIGCYQMFQNYDSP